MKLSHNRKYTTIAIYTVVVFLICLIILRFVFTWQDSLQFFRNGIRLMAPFIISLFFAYFISPMVTFFEKRVLTRIHIRKYYIKSTRALRLLSITLSYFVVLGAFIFLLAIIIPQLAESVTEITERAPDYVESLLNWASHTQITFGEGRYVLDLNLINSYLEQSLPSTLDQMVNVLNAFVPNVLDVTRSIASGVFNIIFGLIIAIYLLYSKETYLSNSRKIFTALLPVHRINPFFSTLRESHKIFSNFFIGKMIDSLIIGLLCFIIMVIARIPYAVLISVIVGITNMIPYFGPFIGGAIGVVFLLISSPMRALWFVVLIIGLQQFDGNILGPKILGDSTGLTPFWVIFAIILFGGMFGLLGMFIGVPCFAVIKNIFDNVIDRRYKEKMAMHMDMAEDSMDY